MDALDHWGDDNDDYYMYECDDCYDTFSDKETLRDHEAEVHYYCDPCDRYFQNYNNISVASPTCFSSIVARANRRYSISTAELTVQPA